MDLHFGDDSVKHDQFFGSISTLCCKSDPDVSSSSKLQPEICGQSSTPLMDLTGSREFLLLDRSRNGGRWKHGGRCIFMIIIHVYYIQ